MANRLQDKVAVVVGAGQTPGDTIGNGRATAILFAREGARVMCVDRNLASAEDTVAMIRKEGGDAKAFDDVNLKGTLFSCKHVLPILRKQLSGSIINISSVAAVCSVGIVAYKASKAAVNALTHSIAIGNARYGIRANVIMPGLMNTPMAIEGISAARGVTKEQLIAERDARVPLGGKMGTAWDVAYAALFLASDEARFITGVMLPVDGGQSARIG
jgi:NAD(P)-dependent dehydrogenase (short-subunit alcohol dehydrogenase family)